MRRVVTTVGGRAVGFRTTGTGRPLVLLHRAPLSARSLEGLAGRLGAGRAVLAVDAPGYGDSDGLGLEAPTIADYARWLAPVLEATVDGRCALYGSHFGAFLAIETAATRPDLVASVILDGFSVLDANERARLVGTPFPDLAPCRDGGHLARAWSVRIDMERYTPWSDVSSAARRRADTAAPRATTAATVDMLSAGPRYADAWNAAFAYEPLSALTRCAVPTTIVGRPSDVYVEHLRRLPALGDRVRVVRPADDAHAERIIAAAAADAAVGTGRLRDAFAPAPRCAAHRLTTTHGAVRVRQSMPGSSAATVIVPAAASLPGPRAATAGDAFFETLGELDSVILVDPSELEAGDDAASSGVAPHGRAVAEAIERLGVEEVLFIGQYDGALVALEAAATLGRGACSLALDVPLVLTPDAPEAGCVVSLPDLEPRRDGSHLFAAWGAARDAGDFWPWCSTDVEHAVSLAPAPAGLHARTLAMLAAPARAREYAMRVYAAAADLDPGTLRDARALGAGDVPALDEHLRRVLAAPTKRPTFETT